MILENELAEEIVVRDVETMKVVSDGLRLQILQAMQQPINVKTIAEMLAMPASKLYYHVNLLEKHKLIQVVAVNIESGIVEKMYQVTARRINIQNPILMGEGLEMETAVSLWANLLDETKEDFLQAYHLRDEQEEPPRYPFATKKALRLTNEQLTEFHAQLDALIQEVDALNAANVNTEAEQFSLTLIFHKDTSDE
jgi:DNA-binding transcriptional ArsR family regulator